MVLTVHVPSSVFNVANFVLFDCFLCALIFILTADIVGRFNAKSASNSSEEYLSPCNPPILGVGLTCTKRHIFYALTAIRLASFLFVLTTNFLIDGATEQSIVYKEASVAVAGNLTSSETYNTIMEKVLRRRSCKSTKDNAEYYGELRTFKDKTSCELNENRLQNTIYFDFAFKRHNLTFVRCAKSKLYDSRRFYCEDKELIHCQSTPGAPENWADNCVDQDFGKYTCGRPLRQANEKYKFQCKPRKEFSSRAMAAKVCQRYYFTIVFSIRCDNGIIGCGASREQINPGSCFATANIGNTTYLCSRLSSHRGQEKGFNEELNKSKISLYASCKKAKGADWRLDSWIPYAMREIPSIEEAYDAIYATGSKKMKVPFVEEQSVSRVSIIWIILLGLQIAMIVGLAGASCFLKSLGLSKVGNGEKELGKLIATCELMQQGTELHQEALNLHETELVLGLRGGELRTSVTKRGVQLNGPQWQEINENLNQGFTSR